MSDVSQDYETIAAPVDVELEISRSRFLTRLERVEDEKGARRVIAEARATHPKSRHHCSAFVLGPDSRIQRSNDDGEPSGTAGAPMLNALVSAGLSDIVAVVTRYFGGVLLGAGGLTRAYGGSVAEAINQATRVRRGMRHEAIIESAYDVAPQIEAEARRRGYTIGDVAYSDMVTHTFLVAEEEIHNLAQLAAELSAGTATCTRGGSSYVDLS